ncbi:MbtH family NRPS accessory protein [Actinosynnema sp. NPDC023587]|uniref:MbtH family protein n=1 Tax=Actinosynnema sp. NPDC023587 TaxID=3154695 RepID=UPI0033D573DF
MTYHVVRNDEDQHSIWPRGRTLPEGWHEVGFSGSEEDCLAEVERRWTDLRPLSARRSG